jgi:hypothetical protein
MWIKPTTTSNRRLIYDFGGSTNGLGLDINGGQLEAVVASNNTRNTINTSFTNTSSWTHVAVVYNGNTIRLFVNGVQAASNTSLSFSSIAASSSSVSRFGYPGGTGSSENAFGLTQSSFTQFSGLMDNIYVIEGALSASEISSLMTTNNIGQSNDTTLSLPIAPNVPTALFATANSASSITINWNDNSSNETAFEIQRSAQNIRR